MNDFAQDNDACYMSQNFYMEIANGGYEDPFSSVSLEVKFANSSEVLSNMGFREPDFDWNKIFSVSFSSKKFHFL
jgi:hypothetical protein